ncbi:hypothetical protein PsYK624_061300 [Phanerochaete sordida]|uniref:Uncharacterized protein n=1 Tax=Phanerochaete sordida TaxID=48140 RepID=A0A9P3LCX2_9APHY|nr:hypothetical protein PsYK624_061300 [Phanerochaete sordida]
MSLYTPLNPISSIAAPSLTADGYTPGSSSMQSACGSSHPSTGHVSANANAPLPNGVPPAAPPPPPTPNNGAHANALPTTRRAAHPHAGLAAEHPTVPLVAADPQRAWTAPLYRSALSVEGA